MKYRFLGCLCGLLTILGCVAATALATDARPAASVFKAGFAERDITPALGMEQPGGYSKVFHRTLHDPCKVRAVVLDDGRSRVALVGIDALLIRSQVVDPVREEICQKCGIPPQAILIGASHSHSSGPTGMILPGEFDEASPLVKTLAYAKSSCADAKYLELVHKQLVDVVCAANQSRAEVRCGIGSGIEDKVAFNRRFRMTNGRSATHPGKCNPEIVEPAGPIDPQVGVVGAWNKQGKLIGCVVNYACHATCNPGGISANWIYYMEQTIRGAFGPDVVVVFLQGACGDITQVDNLNPNVNPAPEQWARLVGGRVGAEAVKILLTIDQGALVPLDVKRKYLDIPRRVPRAERVAKCRELVTQDPKKVNPAEWTFAKEILLLDALLAKHPVARVEVQAIQVGPAVFLTNPAEFFCQLGLDIKKQSPFQFTFPVELANDCVGYVPTEEALGPHGGGYETRLTSYTNLEPTAGRQMVNAAVELARQMRPGAMPQPVKAPVSKTVWPYGAVPPELD